MKKLITLLAITVAAFTAHAQTDGFTTAYTLNSFQVGADSQLFPFRSDLNNGFIEINQQAGELKLTVYRRFSCPPRAMCSMMMPAPVELTMMLTHVGSGFCGGVVLSAQKDLSAQNRGIINLELFDDNGNTCERNVQTVKAVRISITERLPNGEVVISQISGLPTYL